MFHVEHRDASLVRSLTLTPDARTWPSLAGARFAAITAEARAWRRAFGLPTDRPIVMSGHQPGFWHPGIAAKAFALDAVSKRCGGASAWVVVDHVSGAIGSIDVPVREGDRLGTVSVDLIEGVGDRPWALTPARGVRDTSPPATLAEEADSCGIVRGVAALRRHGGEGSVAMQLTRAMLDLLGSSPVLVSTSGLGEGEPMRGLVERMRHDGGAMRSAYNASVAEAPEGGVAALGWDGALGAELPVWSIDRGGGSAEALYERSPLGGDRLLAPRALLMTAVVRLGLCDLFIHGTGGGAYDRVTERWIARWLGEALSPMAVASSDVVLPFAGATLGPGDVAQARWRAHHARHDPAMLGAADAGVEKRRLLEAIERAPRRSTARREAFNRLHELLASVRRAHAGRVEAIEVEALRTEALAGEAAVAGRRDWAFLLSSPATIDALRDRVERAVIGEA